jgi:hypothetical protein
VKAAERAPTTTGAPMPLDDADKKFITELIATSLKTSGEETKKLVEATVGTAIKSLELDKKLEGVKGDLDKKLEAVKPKDEPDNKSTDDKGKGGSKVSDDPEFKKLQAQLEEQRRRSAEAEAAAKRAEETRRANLVRQGLTDALVKNGADPKRVSFAVDSLLNRNVVKLNDKADALLWPMKRTWGEDPNVTAEEAAKEWLSTDEGKFFLPPVGNQGTGDRGGAPPSTGPTTAPRTKDGAVDWSAIAAKANLAPVLTSVD